MTLSTLLIIPFYKHPELVQYHADTLLGNIDELKVAKVKIMLVSDSPDSKDLNDALEKLKKLLEDQGIECFLQVNESNEGFVSSVNVGIEFAIDNMMHALIVNSDTRFYPGTVKEMISVMDLDEKFGFVGARSNDASISTLPWNSNDLNLDPKLAFDFASEISLYLNRFQIVPTASGFFLLIRNSVLREVGSLSLEYSPGYNEENDLIIRANEVGYLAVLANRTFVFHQSSVSFSNSAISLNEKNQQRLFEKFPYYSRTVDRYFSGPVHTLERLVSEVVVKKKRPSVLIDLSFLTPIRNGTNELACRIVKEITKNSEFLADFELVFKANLEQLDFHGLRKDVSRFPIRSGSLGNGDNFTFRLYLAQPFNWDLTLDVWRRAFYNVVYFLDPIAGDCNYLVDEHPEVHNLWSFTAKHASSLGFLSESTRKMFYNRFERKNNEFDFIARPSLDPGSYYDTKLQVNSFTRGNPNKIVVMGNHFKHKQVDRCVSEISSLSRNIEITAFGYGGDNLKNVTSVPSGTMSDQDMDDVFNSSSVVIFPSLYEGFGIPVIKTLAYRKPVIVWNTQVNHEICNSLKSKDLRDLLVFVSDFTELKVKLISLLDGCVDTEMSPRDLPKESNESNFTFTAQAFYEALRKLSQAPLAVDACRSTLNDIYQIMDTKDVKTIVDLYSRIESLESSTSWKVTSPLRQFSPFLRKLYANLRKGST